MIDVAFFFLLLLLLLVTFLFGFKFALFSIANSERQLYLKKEK